VARVLAAAQVEAEGLGQRCASAAAHPPAARCPCVPLGAGGKATVQLEQGDRLRILSPGGGGYGPQDASDEQAASLKRLRVGGGEAAPVAKRAALKGSVVEYRSRQETV
jgi:N-methylhydantoinase B/oxoprolinase/acetone carboxylase alpha subunit